MRVEELLTAAQKSLSHLDNPRLEAEVLLAELLKRDRAFLKAHPEEALTPEKIDQYRAWVKKRADGTPIAYITGHKSWAGLDILVNPSVLIPRDETEVLVEHIVQEVRSKNQESSISVLDIGTGSGCIALALARYFSYQLPVTSYQIMGVDISQGALEVAKTNIQASGFNIQLCQSDLLSGVEAGSLWDIVVANLPYVPEDLKVFPEVEKEPWEAIFSGVDGLDHYRRLCEQLPRINFGCLWIEFLPFQKKALKEIFKTYQIKWYENTGGEIFFACISPDPERHTLG